MSFIASNIVLYEKWKNEKETEQKQLKKEKEVEP